MFKIVLESFFLHCISAMIQAAVCYVPIYVHVSVFAASSLLQYHVTKNRVNCKKQRKFPTIHLIYIYMIRPPKKSHTI